MMRQGIYSTITHVLATGAEVLVRPCAKPVNEVAPEDKWAVVSDNFVSQKM